MRGINQYLNCHLLKYTVHEKLFYRLERKLEMYELEREERQQRLQKRQEKKLREQEEYQRKQRVGYIVNRG